MLLPYINYNVFKFFINYNFFMCVSSGDSDDSDDIHLLY
jgi:hypothetical protein